MIYLHPKVQTSHNHIHKNQKNWYFFNQDDMGQKQNVSLYPPTIECTKILGKI